MKALELTKGTALYEIVGHDEGMDDIYIVHFGLVEDDKVVFKVNVNLRGRAKIQTCLNLSKKQRLQYKIAALEYARLRPSLT